METIISRGLMLKFAQIMEHLFMMEKMGKDNFIIITMMADGNLQSNWAKLGVLCLFSLQNTCFASMTIPFFDSRERVNFLQCFNQKSNFFALILLGFSVCNHFKTSKLKTN